MKTVGLVMAILLVIGGLNWGLWGLFQFDLVAALFGGNTAVLSRIIYSVVGIAAAYQAIAWKSMLRRSAEQNA